jgi:hypothetical protein
MTYSMGFLSEFSSELNSTVGPGDQLQSMTVISSGFDGYGEKNRLILVYNCPALLE